MKMIIYSRSGCGYCVRAKKLLESKGVEYEDRPIGSRYTKETLKEHCHKLNSNAIINTVPQIIMVRDGHETYIGGYKELTKLQDIL